MCVRVLCATACARQMSSATQATPPALLFLCANPAASPPHPTPPQPPQELHNGELLSLCYSHTNHTLRRANLV